MLRRNLWATNNRVIPSSSAARSLHFVIPGVSSTTRQFQWSSSKSPGSSEGKKSTPLSSANTPQQAGFPRPSVNIKDAPSPKAPTATAPKQDTSSSFKSWTATTPTQTQQQPKQDNNNKRGQDSPSSSGSSSQNPNPEMHSVGIDPSEMGSPGSVRLEVQVTVMQGKMKAFEKKLDDNMLKLTKLDTEMKMHKQLAESTSENDSEEDKKNREKSRKKAIEIEISISKTKREVSSCAAAWMSTALTLSSLLESEEGHREEIKIILTEILDKLTWDEFRALETPKEKQPSPFSIKNVSNASSSGGGEAPTAAEEEEVEDKDEMEFFTSHEDSIRVASLVRLAKIEHDLGNFEEALKASQKAIDTIMNQARKILMKSDEKQSNNTRPGDDDDDNACYFLLIKNSSIRYEWLLLCKTHTVNLDALNKTSEEQRFLENAIINVDNQIEAWNLLRFDTKSGDTVETKTATTNNSKKDDDDKNTNTSAEEKTITAIPQEAIAFVELIMRYADSLGMEEGGQGWKKPQDPIFIKKRKVCENFVSRYYPLLSQVHPVILQARSCLALDCGSAVSREETISIMMNLINDAKEYLAGQEKVVEKEEEEARKSGFNDVLGTANEDLFALRAAILLWQRKLALAYADLKRFDEALKLLEETSLNADEILGVSHKDSIVNLRCWMKVAWVSGNEEKAKELHGKLTHREKPPSI